MPPEEMERVFKAVEEFNTGLQAADA